MDRRTAVKNMTLLFGGALSATTIGVFLDSCQSPSGKLSITGFSAEQQLLITELADIIIPSTKTPGAKAAGVGSWIAEMVRECYPEAAQNVFLKGLDELEELSEQSYSKSFLKITPQERAAVVEKLRIETISAQKDDEKEKAAADQQLEKTRAQKSAKEDISKPMAAKLKEDPKPYFFSIIRDLTLLGYFTSETGATQAYEYLHVPGRYDGDAPLKPGQRTWATN